MLDLFDIANHNADAVAKAFESAAAALPESQSKLLREFAAWVEGQALGMQVFTKPLASYWWFIAGSPHESFQVVVDSSNPKEQVRKTDNAAIEADIPNRVERDGFDYLQLGVSHGEGGCPKDYSGMSGGGIWLIRLDITGEDERTLGFTPILSGIAYHQSGVYPNGRRIITAHGFDSLYRKAVSAITAPRT